MPACAISNADTDLPYESYVYNNDTEPVAIPAPYTVSKTISGQDIGVGNFGSLADVFYDGDSKLYISDSSGNRIIVTDTQFKLIKIIDSFSNEGAADTFNMPTSCFVNDKKIYIADSKNSRIVILDKETYSLLQIIGRPEISLLKKDYTYTPTDVVADNAGRLYVIADGINEGLIRLEEDGTFTSFFGAPSVEYSIFQMAWRKIATKEQKRQMEQFVPTEYDSILIDKKGFLYVVSKTSDKTPVAKINTNGENVLFELQGEDDKYGDKTYLSKLGEASSTYFTDICISKNGTYTILDSQQSKIYVYSDDGYLLYVFGANGSQKGTFYSASSIEQVGDRILVSDGNKGTITVFTLTNFGATVQSAISYYNAGDYDKSYTEWESVYSYSSNYTPAISGMAKIDIVRGNSTKAMQDLKKVHAHKLYSKAFEAWRNEVIRKYFVWFIVALIAFFVLFAILKKPVKNSKLYKKYHESDYYKKQKFATYTMFHPFDGYWDLKREKRGDLKTAIEILAMFIVCFAVRAQFSGYVTTRTISDDVNVIYSVILIILPILFWVISNWCFSTLMEGEGTFKDIVIVTCYALKPYVVMSIPLLILSQVLTVEETMFYGVLNSFCWIWVLAFFFFGMMTTHNYSLGKAVITAILSLVGICIIIFILLLIASIVQGMYEYFFGIFKELSFRTY